MDDNKNLIDLCRLNLMQEHIQGGSAVDRDQALKAIDWKKRRLMEKIKREQSKV